MTRLRASYRVQLRAGVTLGHARALLPYLDRLGVSHVYLSPILCAREGSSHGYDATDPARVDPALGGEPAFARLARGARARGMGLLVDLVPNHMAADAQNPWFLDVLRHGPHSRHARWFDVDWEHARGRLRLPFLGDRRARVLARGELRLELGGSELWVRYFERAFPLADATLPRALRAPLEALRRRPRSARARSACRSAVAAFASGAKGRARLERLLARQAYRLEHWRSARHRLDYRRFFDIGDLVALRAEDPEVFDASHARIRSGVARGEIDALRIDHVDGLLDPLGYLERLRRAAPVPILVEKILAPGEELPRRWPVAGTTGYEFLNQLERTFVEPQGFERLVRDWRRTAGLRRSFEEVARAGKRRALRELLRADVRRLARGLAELEGGPAPPRGELEAALVETAAALGVYRVYPGERGALSRRERGELTRALSAAERRTPPRAVARLRRALGLAPSARRAAPAERRAEFARRFGQLSGPAAAKGVEDTAHYLYVPLLSLSEVGGEPSGALGDALARFHAACARRARLQPGTLLATTTHDTKRSADVRARLDVLSEVPADWAAALARWRHWGRSLRRRVRGRPAPDPNTEFLLYQALVGIWPLRDPAAAGALPRRAELRLLRERLAEYATKACREAKAHTSWVAPDAAFESALDGFVRGLLDPAAGAAPGRGGKPAAARRILIDLDRFVAQIARPGLWNALARTLVQLSAPGVPDLYQGDELWSFALVDPDNRRPVDYARRRRLLTRVERAAAASPPARRRWARRRAETPEDPAIKLHVVRSVLGARRRHPELFRAGAYHALAARGERAGHVIAFARRRAGRAALVVAPRLTRGLCASPERPPLGPEAWGRTALVLPRWLAGRRLESVLTGERLRVPGGHAPRLALGGLLAAFPVALLLDLGEREASRR